MSSSMLEAEGALECLIKGDAKVFLGEAEFTKDHDSTILCNEPLFGKNRLDYTDFLSKYKKHRFLVKYKTENEKLNIRDWPEAERILSDEPTKITMTIESKNLREELKRLFE